MRKKWLFLIIASFLLCACNNIPNKSISESLNTEELSNAIKSDTLFSNFYEHLRTEVESLSDIKKAKYHDITYRRLFQYIKFSEDTTYWNPLVEQWSEEWKVEYGAYLGKADSVITYWKQYLEDNSLNKYVNVELAKIDKDYYSYSYDIKDVDLGFRLTPLQGGIEQIVFTYGYQAKIHEEARYYEKHRCRSTTPFSVPTIRYWEVDYSDRKLFSGHTVETFLRDYNLHVEITNIRKDGENMSVDDFNTPEAVSDYLKHGEDDDFMKDYYKEKIIVELINKDYLRQWEYYEKRADVLKEKKDKLCFDFLKEL